MAGDCEIARERALEAWAGRSVVVGIRPEDIRVSWSVAGVGGLSLTDENAFGTWWGSQRALLLSWGRPDGSQGGIRVAYDAELGDAVGFGEEVVEVDRRVVLVDHLLDVGAGGEGLLAAGNDDGADAGIGIEAAQRVAQFRHQLVAQRIQRLWPVQPDQPGLAVGFNQDHFKCHGGSPSSVVVDSLLAQAQRCRSGQKKLDRPDCTMRLTPRQSGLPGQAGQASPSRP